MNRKNALAALLVCATIGLAIHPGAFAQDKFPSPVRLANRAIAWRRTDLEQWSEGRPIVTH